MQGETMSPDQYLANHQFDLVKWFPISDLSQDQFNEHISPVFEHCPDPVLMVLAECVATDIEEIAAGIIPVAIEGKSLCMIFAIDKVLLEMPHAAVIGILGLSIVHVTTTNQSLKKHLGQDSMVIAAIHHALPPGMDCPCPHCQVARTISAAMSAANDGD
jgi:hypothetical protein